MPDEHELLQKAVKMIRGADNELLRLQAENKRLREALLAFMESDDSTYEDWLYDTNDLSPRWALAARALSTTEDRQE